MDTIRFDDFIKLNRGFDLPDSQIEAGEYPVVASTNIKAYHKAYKVEGPMVVTGRSGSLGKVQYIEGRCWPLNTSLYVKDFKGNNPRYVYYYLKTMHLEQYNAGVGVPTLNQNHLHSLKICIHNKEEQPRVASILSAYDNLIENNTHRIRLLEQMAENIYKEWFVRFRFPGHENAEFENGLPKGWKTIKISDAYNTCSGGTPNRQKSEYYNNGTIAWVKTGEIQDSFIYSTEEMITENGLKHSSAKLLPQGTLLMAMYGVNIGKLGFITQEMACNQAACAFLDKGDKPTLNYLFYFLKSIRDYLLSIGFGAAQQNISQALIKSIKMVMPTDGILNKFHLLTKPIFEQIVFIQRQSDLLARQRDLLLPRLMSGNLEVKG